VPASGERPNRAGAGRACNPAPPTPVSPASTAVRNCQLMVTNAVSFLRGSGPFSAKDLSTLFSRLEAWAHSGLEFGLYGAVVLAATLRALFTVFAWRATVFLTGVV